MSRQAEQRWLEASRPLYARRSFVRPDGTVPAAERGLVRDVLASLARMLDDVVMAQIASMNAVCINVPPIARDPIPYWNDSATTGRQYGGDKPGVPNNPAQPVTGEPPCGAGGHPGISHQASGQFFNAWGLVFGGRAGVEL